MIFESQTGLRVRQTECLESNTELSIPSEIIRLILDIVRETADPEFKKKLSQINP